MNFPEPKVGDRVVARPNEVRRMGLADGARGRIVVVSKDGVLIEWDGYANQIVYSLPRLTTGYDIVEEADVADVWQDDLILEP